MVHQYLESSIVFLFISQEFCILFRMEEEEGGEESLIGGNVILKTTLNWRVGCLALHSC